MALGPIVITIALGCGLTLGVVGCQPRAAQEVANVNAYESRGIVRRLPDNSQSMPMLQLQHEAINNFQGIDGQMTEMQSMTMPFPIREGLDWSAIQVGDRVRFTFETQWEASPPFQVTALEPLGPETRLDFEESETNEAETSSEKDAELGSSP